MFDLTVLDYIYVGVILASTIWATIRGGIYETVATLSWVVAAVTARFTSPMLDKLLQDWFKLSDSTVGTLVASYFIVFFAILLLVGFINQKLRDKIQESIMNVTDHTLGVIFGIIRGVVVMGLVYWGMLWYYSDTPGIPSWIENARTRPLMQLTAIKLDQWFIPGADNRLLQRDMTGTREAMAIYNNLINPAVSDSATKKADAQAKPETKKEKKAPKAKPETKENKAKNTVAKPDKKTETEESGYKKDERDAVQKQLQQIDAIARAVEKHETARQSDQHSDAD